MLDINEICILHVCYVPILESGFERNDEFWYKLYVKQKSYWSDKD
jgi:hypothetical protein